MENFAKLFGNLLAFVYHCFDRIVIQGYLPLLAREAHIVYWFRNVLGVYPVTTEALKKRTEEYRQLDEFRICGRPRQWFRRLHRFANSSGNACRPHN